MTADEIDRVWDELEWKDLNALSEGFARCMRRRFARALLDRASAATVAEPSDAALREIYARAKAMSFEHFAENARAALKSTQQQAEQHLASSDPEAHRQSIIDHEAEQQADPGADERAAFEAWMKTSGGYPYAGQFANLMWEAWQAHAAQSGQRAGVVGTYSPCQGMNCGCTDGVNHSAECQAEHAASVAGGRFVKGVTPITDALIEHEAGVFGYYKGDMGQWVFDEYQLLEFARSVISQAGCPQAEVPDGWSVEIGECGYEDKNVRHVTKRITIKHIDFQCSYDFFEDTDKFVYSFIAALAAPTQQQEGEEGDPK